jgi:hypothetical protein
MTRECPCAGECPCHYGSLSAACDTQRWPGGCGLAEPAPGVAYTAVPDVPSGHCRHGQRCPGRDQEGNGAPTYKPLCDDDCTDLTRALLELPKLLLALERELPRQQMVGGEKVAGSKDLSLPIREGVDELMRHIVAVARGWAVAVCARTDDKLPERRTLNTMLQAATAVLYARVPVLINLPHRWCMRDGQWVALDGADGACELMALHSRARWMVGAQRKTTLLTEPCPACKVPAVTHRDGADHVRCRSCRLSLSTEQWAEATGQEVDGERWVRPARTAPTGPVVVGCSGCGRWYGAPVDVPGRCGCCLTGLSHDGAPVEPVRTAAGGPWRHPVSGQEAAQLSDGTWTVLLDAVTQERLGMTVLSRLQQIEAAERDRGIRRAS